MSLLENGIPVESPISLDLSSNLLNSGLLAISDNIGIFPTEVDWRKEIRIWSIAGSQLQTILNTRDSSYLNTLFPRLCDDSYITRGALRSGLSKWFRDMEVSLDGMLMHCFVNKLFELFRNDKRYIHVCLLCGYNVDASRVCMSSISSSVSQG